MEAHEVAVEAGGMTQGEVVYLRRSVQERAGDV